MKKLLLLLLLVPLVFLGQSKDEMINAGFKKSTVKKIYKNFDGNINMAIEEWSNSGNLLFNKKFINAAISLGFNKILMTKKLQIAKQIRKQKISKGFKNFSKKTSSVIKVDKKNTELNNPRDDWNSLDLKHISLYSYKAQLSAYVDTHDENNIIYVFSGEARPVAYLSIYENYYAIYGFNGNHLGWYENGIVRDHEGYPVGFRKGAINMRTKTIDSKYYTSSDGFKMTQKNKPLKKKKPLRKKPYNYKETFSTKHTLHTFLKKGR